MRILDLKDLELVAGADGNYNYPVLTDAEKAGMTPEQIAEWDAAEFQKYNDWLYGGDGGDRQADWEWIQAHGNGTW